MSSLRQFVNSLQERPITPLSLVTHLSGDGSSQAGRSRLVRKLCLIPLLIFPALSGCPDLTQVQQLAKTADAGKSALATIATDFKGSCDRQNVYYTLPPAQPGQPLPTPPSFCADGDDLDKLGANLLKEQSVLIAYFDSLGSLAGASTSGFDGVAPKLDTSFKNAGFNSTQQEMAKAGGTLAAAITKLATGAYRSKRIAEILKETNDAVRTVTTDLANEVDPDPEPSGGGHFDSYMGLLLNEDVQIDSFYRPIEAKYGTDNPSGALFYLQRRSALTDQAKRKEAARGYRKYMLALQEAHNKLTVGAGSFEKDEIVKLANELAQPLTDLVDSINTLQKDVR